MKKILTKKIPNEVVFIIVVVCAIAGTFLQKGITTGAVIKILVGIFIVGLVFAFSKKTK